MADREAGQDADIVPLSRIPGDQGQQVTVTLVNLSADTDLATRIHLDDARALGPRGRVMSHNDTVAGEYLRRPGKHCARCFGGVGRGRRRLTLFSGRRRGSSFLPA